MKFYWFWILKHDQLNCSISSSKCGWCLRPCLLLVPVLPNLKIRLWKWKRGRFCWNVKLCHPKRLLGYTESKHTKSNRYNWCSLDEQLCKGWGSEISKTPGPDGSGGGELNFGSGRPQTLQTIIFKSFSTFSPWQHSFALTFQMVSRNLA